MQLPAPCGQALGAVGVEFKAVQPPEAQPGPGSGREQQTSPAVGPLHSGPHGDARVPAQRTTLPPPAFPDPRGPGRWPAPAPNRWRRSSPSPGSLVTRSQTCKRSRSGRTSYQRPVAVVTSWPPTRMTGMSQIGDLATRCISRNARMATAASGPMNKTAAKCTPLASSETSRRSRPKAKPGDRPGKDNLESLPGPSRRATSRQPPGSSPERRSKTPKRSRRRPWGHEFPLPGGCRPWCVLSRAHRGSPHAMCPTILEGLGSAARAVMGHELDPHDPRGRRGDAALGECWPRRFSMNLAWCFGVSHTSITTRSPFSSRPGTWVWSPSGQSPFPVLMSIPSCRPEPPSELRPP